MEVPGAKNLASGVVGHVCKGLGQFNGTLQKYRGCGAGVAEPVNKLSIAMFRRRKGG
jgi:hypothetical protein